MAVDKPNYTQVPNLLLDDLMLYMSEAELKVTLAIARRTFGYHRETVKLSLSVLQGLTGLSRPAVIKGLQAGMERGVIGRTKDADGVHVYHLEINGEASAQGGKQSLPVNDLNQGGKQNLPAVVNDLNQGGKQNLPLLVNDVYQNTPALKKEKEKTTKKRERKEGAQAPARAPAPPGMVASGQPGARARRINSPHLDARRFANGYIPPGTARNAVEVYYERFNITQESARLSAPLEDDLVRVCTDLDRLREVVTAYSQNQHYQRGNIKLILDWYRDGIPQRERSARQELRTFNRRSNVADNGAAVDQFFARMEAHPDE